MPTTWYIVILEELCAVQVVVQYVHIFDRIGPQDQ